MIKKAICLAAVSYIFYRIGYRKGLNRYNNLVDYINKLETVKQQVIAHNNKFLSDFTSAVHYTEGNIGKWTSVDDFAMDHWIDADKYND